MATMTYCHWFLLGILFALTSATSGETCSGRAGRGDESAEYPDNPWTSPLQNTTASPPKGIGLLGRGFDIYRGNLFSEDGDIGFRLPVIRLDYQKNKRTLDNSYLIPDKSDLLQIVQSTPNATAHLTEIRTPPDFLRMLNNKVNVHGQPSLADGRFQASKAYRELLVAFGRETVLYNIEERPLYLASLEGSTQKATKSFVETFNKLPRECTAETRPFYMDFITAYGTHVTSQVTLGPLLVQRVHLNTDRMIQLRIKGNSIQDIFQGEKSDNQETSQWTELEYGVAPISTRLEPLETYITSFFMGSEATSDIIPRRECLIKNIAKYCQVNTNQICREDESAGSLRYGDEVELSTPENEVLLIASDSQSIGRNIVGFPLNLVTDNMRGTQQMSLLVVPSPGQNGRLGEPVMYNDVFSLATPQIPEQRVELSWQYSGVYLATKDDKRSNKPLFYDVQTGSSKYDPVMFVQNQGERSYAITFKTSGPGNSLVTDAGPWSFTIQTSRADINFLVDPCVNLCLPGSATTATVTISAESGEIQRIQLKPLPKWSEISTRPGIWSVTSLTMLDTTTNDIYTVGPFQISSEPSTCSQCTNGEWLMQNGITKSSPVITNRIDSQPINGEFYFVRANPLSYASMIVSNKSNVVLHTRGINDAGMKAGSCSELLCQHDGECVKIASDMVQCRCTRDWTGLLCETPCTSEILRVQDASVNPRQGIFQVGFGSSGYFSNRSSEWIFPSSQENNFIVIPLNGRYKASAIQLPQSVDMNTIQIEGFDLETQRWIALDTRRTSTQADTYFLSSRNTGSILINKVKVIYRGESLALAGFVLYGCVQEIQHKYLSYTLQSKSFTLVNKHKGAIQNRLDGDIQTNIHPLEISEQVEFVLYINDSVQCETTSERVRWAVARQLDICPTLISINKIQAQTDLSNLKTIHIGITLSGEQYIILPAKSLADKLIDSGKMSLDCAVLGLDTRGDLDDKVSGMETRLIILMAVLLLLVLICLVLFIVFMVRLSYKYRDIHNELTTIRKLKMQKRIAKRQELQPQVPYHSFTLPRPNSAGSSSATTSIPGRNGQMRPLRYSQSLHGQNDRARAAGLNAITGRGSIDPTNYIISNPAPVVRTPSPGGTKSGEDSDTVQSIC